MADALERYQASIAEIPAQRSFWNQASIAEIPAQRFGGVESDGAVSRPPDEQRGVIANLGQRALQFREVGGPIPNDVRSMPEDVILEHRYTVACERIVRNFCSIAEHAAQPQVVQGAPVRKRVAYE